MIQVIYKMIKQGTILNVFKIILNNNIVNHKDEYLIDSTYVSNGLNIIKNVTNNYGI